MKKNVLAVLCALFVAVFSFSVIKPMADGYFRKSRAMDGYTATRSATGEYVLKKDGTIILTMKPKRKPFRNNFSI